jgi:hypothetical protein
MRRMLLLACAVVLLGSVAVVAIASTGSSGRPKSGPPGPERPRTPAGGPFALAAEQGGGAARPAAGRHRAALAVHLRELRPANLYGQVVVELSGRLGVKTRDLVVALETARSRALTRAVRRGAITAADRETIESCVGRSGCDRPAARAAARRLRDDLTPETLATRKADLVEDLAGSLGRPVDDVTGALRVELDVKLDAAEGLGLITPHGRELAMACFDRPAACDLGAVRRELFIPHHAR